MGLKGEKLAGEFLMRRGWRIEGHRFRMGRLEVDLIARRGPLVVFVEVKTRYGTAFGSPLEAVTARKQREIVRVARAWIDRYGKPGDQYRLDVIAVTFSGGLGPKIEHIQNAFWPGWR